MKSFCCLFLSFLCTLSEQRFDVGLLRGSSLTLRYLNGNCSWILTIAGLVFNDPESGLMVPQKVVTRNITRATFEFNVKCVVADEELLEIFFTVYNVDKIPLPTNISLNKTMLDWNHVLQPSNLPSEFQIIPNDNISYLVNVTDRDSGERGETLTSNETSLDISSLLDHCRGQKFTVQTRVNGQFYSQAASFSHEANVSTAPEFVHLMASFELGSPLRVRVEFELDPMNCLSQFTIAVHGVANISFNVTRAEVARGMVIHDLSSDLTLMDVCDARNEIYGGNEIGNSSPVEVRAQRVLEVCFSKGTEVVPESTTAVSSHSTSTTRETPTASPTTPTHTSSQSQSPSNTVTIVILTVLALLVLTLIITTFLVIIFIIRKCRGRRSKVAEDPPLQTNEAYCTVTTGVPMQRNEAYETVPRPSATTNPITSPVYDTVL